MPPQQFSLAAFIEYIANPMVYPITALINVTNGVKSGLIPNSLAILIFITVIIPVKISIAVQLRSKKNIIILDVDNFILCFKDCLLSLSYCFNRRYSFFFYHCSFY